MQVVVATELSHIDLRIYVSPAGDNAMTCNIHVAMAVYLTGGVCDAKHYPGVIEGV